MNAEINSQRSSSDALADRVAVVTGSSRGIGREIALHLARHGASVLIHARTGNPSAAEVCKQAAQYGVDSTVVPADFSSAVEVDRFAEQAWNWRSGIDIWVNNAGADVLTGAAADWSCEDKLATLWQVDVRATWKLCRVIGSRMVECRSADKPGVILNMGWDQAWQGMGTESGLVFSTTKGAIMSMSKSFAQYLAPHVRVNCLAPGWIQTEWGRQAGGRWDARARHESLMNRWGTPADVAGVAAFLASDAAAFVSGQIVEINGGFRFGQDG